MLFVRRPKSRRSRLIITAFLSVLALAFNAMIEARAWEPEHPVELIVPTSPGGGLDQTARIIEKIARENKLLNVPITIINKPGGGANVALAYLQQRPADGHTLLIAATALLTNHILGLSNVSYRDLTPVSTMFSEYIATMIMADSPLTNPKNLIDKLRKSTNSVSFGFCCALGAGNHIAAAVLVKAVGGNVKEMRTVVFKGGGDVIAALLGGHIMAVTGPATNAIGSIERREIKVVAIAAPHRLRGMMKGVPTWRDEGLDVVAELSRNVFGPKGMPKDRVQFWEQFFQKLDRTKSWQNELDKNMWNNTFMNGAETARYLEERYQGFREILTELGLAKR